MGNFGKRTDDLKKKIAYLLHNKYYYHFKKRSCSLPENDGTKIRVCFILQRTEIFPSVQTVFESMCTDQDFEVSVLVLPRYDQTKQRFETENIDKSLDFCRNLGQGFTVISSWNQKAHCYREISRDEFDFIFLGVPYRAQYPAPYQIPHLAELSRLCYITYGSSYADAPEMIKLSVTNVLLSNVDYFFADCRKVYDYASEKLSMAENRDKKPIVYSAGFPRFDLVERNRETDKIRTFLWLPRWSYSKDPNETSTFLEHREELLGWFSEHKDYTLIIRPHPLMFRHFLEDGVITPDQADIFRKKVQEASNIFLDESASYLTSLSKADCLIADYTSVAIEYYLSGRPVIYLNKTDYIDPDISDGYYICEPGNNILPHLEQLAGGRDEKKNYRLSSLMKPDYQKGANERIVRILKEAINGNTPKKRR